MNNAWLAAQIEYTAIIEQGETPYTYTSEPRELTGAWGITVFDAIRHLESNSPFKVMDFWIIGNTLWMTTTQPAKEA